MIEKDTGNIARIVLFIEREGERLAREHPEIADLYRTQTQPQLAKQFVSDDIRNREVARTVVQYALTQLLSEGEMQELGREHKGWGGTYEGRSAGGRNQPLESKAKGGSYGGRSKGGTNSVRSRGLTPWNNPLEILFVLAAAGSEKYVNSRGVSNSRIAEEANMLFHDGKEVRDKHSVYNFRRRQPNLYKAVQDLITH